jgi:FtsH-binding integral membrane protein
MTTAASTVNLHTSESTTLNTRAAFITRTYLHLLGAILGFILVELFLFSSGLSKPIAEFLLSVPWLGVLTAFSVVGWLATKTAGSVESKAAQYVALTGFVLAEALIFVPMLYIAQNVAPGIIETSAVVTCLAFGSSGMLVGGFMI